jgi:hypothetical protein
LDTDVELISSLDTLLNCNAFFGLENDDSIATGLGFGAVANTPIIIKIADDYINIPFLLPDGSYDLTPCPERNTKVFYQFGFVPNGTFQILKDEIYIYPPEYFNPKDFQTGKITITNNTKSIHHFDGSWFNPTQKKQHTEYQKIVSLFGVRTGERILLIRNTLRDKGFLALIRKIVSHFS